MGQSDDVEYRQKSIPARQGLARLLAATGNVADRIAELRKGVEDADELILTEPNNTMGSNSPRLRGSGLRSCCSSLENQARQTGRPRRLRICRATADPRRQRAILAAAASGLPRRPLGNRAQIR